MLDEKLLNLNVWALQKYVNLVDLVKSFPTSICLQKSASIQPRTSLSKFADSYTLPPPPKVISSALSTSLKTVCDLHGHSQGSGCTCWRCGLCSPRTFQRRLTSRLFRWYQANLVQASRSDCRTRRGCPWPGVSVHEERANFTRLVLGCIEAKFCKWRLMWKLSPKSAQCTPLHRFLISIVLFKKATNITIWSILPNYKKLNKQ